MHLGPNFLIQKFYLLSKKQYEKNLSENNLRKNGFLVKISIFLNFNYVSLKCSEKAITKNSLTNLKKPNVTFKKKGRQNYHVLIGSIYYMAWVAKLLVHMIDFCLKNFLTIEVFSHDVFI